MGRAAGWWRLMRERENLLYWAHYLGAGLLLMR
jgi:hypothetical protein